jgi:hypothetical protein
MGVNFNPGIVTDGLSLHLDPMNTKSYPGSGSNWTDVAQGINFTSSGTQTPLETKNGAICFGFNGSGYWTSDSNHTLVDMGGDCTLIMWVFDDGNRTIRRTIFEKQETTVSHSYRQEIAVTWEISGDREFSYFSRNSPNYDTATIPPLQFGSGQDNIWKQFALKMSTGRTSSARTGFYSVNGAPWASSYNSRSDTALVTAGAIHIGEGYAGIVESGNIGLVTCYNKMLDDTEIAQNFEAMRGRFGL